MKRTLSFSLAALVGGFLWAAAAASQAVSGPNLAARLSGAEGGDSDGSGTFTAEVDRETGQLCYELTASGIDEASAAHIHRGAEGESGPPVVGLDAPAGGSAQGCESVAADLLAEIVGNPGAFYVNVHNAEFRAGAIRGQLTTGS